MESLVGKKFSYKGLVLGDVVVLTEPRTGFYVNDKGEVSTSKSCLVKCKCGSRHEVLFKNISNHHSGKCKVCNYRNKTAKGIKRVKSLFEYWMPQWKPETHKTDTYKLPFFKGGAGEEYIAGFCYTSKGHYEHFSKVMCIKAKLYIKHTYNKDNCKRLGIEYKGCRVKCVFVHKYTQEIGKPHMDHINSITLDNRLCNLRGVTPQENSFNSRTQCRNTSGYKGIVTRTGGGRYEHHQVQAMLNGHYFSRCFPSLEDAVEYRDCLALYLHGEYAKLNEEGKREYYQDNLYHILTEEHIKLATKAQTA